MNDAFSAAEARHLAEPDDWGFCDRLGCLNIAAEGSILCHKHEDAEYEAELQATEGNERNRS